MESLKSKTLHGIGWSSIENIASTGITFVIGLILARLLSPLEFGTIGVIMIFIAIGNTFIEVGFNAAIIRKIDVRECDFNTTFYVGLVIAFLLYVFLWILAPAIERFFEESEIYWQIRVTALMLPLGAMSVVQRAIFTREINFKVQTKIILISAIVSGAVGVCMAFMGFGVWSLVVQILLKTALQTLLFWIYCKWKPKLEFSRESFNELFAFSSKLLGASMIETLYRNMYSVIIGKIYSVGLLGQYNRAMSFSNIFSVNISNVVQRVSFPVLSTIQNEPERLKQAYRRVIKMTMLVTFMLMLGLVAVAKPMVIVMIGEKWLPAVYFLQILCFSEMFYPLHAINLNILNVVGRSDLFLRLEIYKKIIALPTIIIGIFGGLEWMLWSSVLVALISYLLNVYYSASLIGYSTREQLKDILPLFFMASCVAISMWSITWFDIPYLFMLIVQLIIGGTIAVVLCETFKFEEYCEMKMLLLLVIKKRINERK